MGLDEGAWLERYAGELGVAAPSAQEREQLLALAGIAAHAAQRTAAPLSCWLAARAGADPAAALEIARRLAAQAGGPGEAGAAERPGETGG